MCARRNGTLASDRFGRARRSTRDVLRNTAACRRSRGCKRRRFQPGTKAGNSQWYTMPADGDDDALASTRVSAIHVTQFSSLKNYQARHARTGPWCARIALDSESGTVTAVAVAAAVPCCHWHVRTCTGSASGRWRIPVPIATCTRH